MAAVERTPKQPHTCSASAFNGLVDQISIRAPMPDLADSYVDIANVLDAARDAA